MKNRDIEPGLWEVSLLGGFSSAICVDGIRYDDDEIQFRHRGQCVLRADQAELIGYRRVDSAQLLVKFIPRKDWADSHRHGVHMQPASKYFEIEKDDPGGIYDKYDMGVAVGHEAITFSLWPQGHDDRKVEINTRHGLREPATIRYKDADRLYMTCFSCVSVSCSDLKVNGDFDPRFLRVFGRHAVVIRRPQIFLSRIYYASVEGKYWMRAGKVDYYEQPNIPDIADFVRMIFSKRMQYSWQREYRILVDPNIDGEPPSDLFLDLMMEDISGRCDF